MPGHPGGTALFNPTSLTADVSLALSLARQATPQVLLVRRVLDRQTDFQADLNWLRATPGAFQERVRELIAERFRAEFPDPDAPQVFWDELVRQLQHDRPTDTLQASFTDRHSAVQTSASRDLQRDARGRFTPHPADGPGTTQPSGSPGDRHRNNRGRFIPDLTRHAWRPEGVILSLRLRRIMSRYLLNVTELMALLTARGLQFSRPAFRTLLSPDVIARARQCPLSDTEFARLPGLLDRTEHQLAQQLRVTQPDGTGPESSAPDTSWKAAYDRLVGRLHTYRETHDLTWPLLHQRLKDVDARSPGDLATFKHLVLPVLPGQESRPYPQARYGRVSSALQRLEEAAERAAPGRTSTRWRGQYRQLRTRLQTYRAVHALGWEELYAQLKEAGETQLGSVRQLQAMGSATVSRDERPYPETQHDEVQQVLYHLERRHHLTRTTLLPSAPFHPQEVPHDP